MYWVGVALSKVFNKKQKLIKPQVDSYRFLSWGCVNMVVRQCLIKLPGLLLGLSSIHSFITDRVLLNCNGFQIGFTVERFSYVFSDPFFVPAWCRTGFYMFPYVLSDPFLCFCPNTGYLYYHDVSNDGLALKAFEFNHWTQPPLSASNAWWA